MRGPKVRLRGLSEIATNPLCLIPREQFGRRSPPRIPANVDSHLFTIRATQFGPVSKFRFSLRWGALGTGGERPVVGVIDVALNTYMTGYQRSPDYVGLRPTCKAGDLLVLNDDDVVDLLKAAVKREGSQTTFAKRYDVNRTELNSILNGKRGVSASLAKALGLRRVYVVEEEAKKHSERLSSLTASQAGLA